jgi:hypothetical protein
MSFELGAAVSFALLLAGADGQAEAQRPVTATLTGLPRDVACAASSPATRPVVSLTIAAGRETTKKLFGPGDAVIVSGGTAQGVRTGDEFFVRRVVADNFTAPVAGQKPPISVHTSGMLRIVEAQTDVSIATITYGCDGIGQGDYLERFEAPVMPPGTPAGTPDFARPGRLILGDDRRQIGGAGEFMVIDRGSDHGLRPGQRITIFRQTLPDGSGPVSTVGLATVYVVRAETAVVRIDQTNDAVYIGDFVAIHR